MDECYYCQIIENKIKSKKIYEDDKSFAFLSPNPSTIGHIVVIPKKHYPIIEQVPDSELAHSFEIANKLSTVLFDSLNIQGTNIIAENGIPSGQKVAHFAMNIIPRREKDGLNFEWQPKQLNEEEMSTVELKLKEAINTTAIIEEEKAEPINLEKKNKKISDDEGNYLTRQLRRIP